MGIKAYITKELMPTPFLSFAVRHLKADAGVMITASHNPSEYNGYKVYGSDGCQVTDNGAAQITEFINKRDAFEVETRNFESCLKQGNIEYIDDSVTDEYIKNVKSCLVNGFCDIKICYTPLNGTGYNIVPKVLKDMGADLVFVDEQNYPDGNFHTCPYPNPEKKEALKLGLSKAMRHECDLLLATDPDADRVGVGVKNGNDMILLTGNETGILLTHYILSQKALKGVLPRNPLIIKTIVTTKLAEKIAEDYNAQVRETLTGFKYIGEQIGLLEKQGAQNRFVFGFEESYGYLAGSYVRDKDAVSACMLIAEMASYYKRQGKTLTDVLDEIYSKYGKYEHMLKTIQFEGADGAEKMRQLLNGLRNKNIDNVGGLNVLKFTDFLTQKERELPPANVLIYDLIDNAQLVIRPSGTEPLIKFYMTAAKDSQKNKEIFSAINAFIERNFCA